MSLSKPGTPARGNDSSTETEMNSSWSDLRLDDVVHGLLKRAKAAKAADAKTAVRSSRKRWLSVVVNGLASMMINPGQQLHDMRDVLGDAAHFISFLHQARRESCIRLESTRTR